MALTKKELVRQFNEKLENELRKIYKFFVQQERELYLKINLRLHVRKRYENFSMLQLNKELDELQDLSNFAMSVSSFIYINITGMQKIMKKFDKKFKRYNFNFSKKFIIEKFSMKNSDLLYIYQYKILDEIGACVEELYFELREQYYFLLKNPLIEANNSRADSLNKKIKKEINTNLDGGLFNEGSKAEILVGDKEKNEDNQIELHLPNDENIIKNKLFLLKESINNMEAFYHQTSIVFNIWKRYLLENDYKSHVYYVKSAGEIDTNSDIDSSDDIENEKNNNSSKVKHYLSSESYWNIRIILIQALIMSICSSYIHPTMYYILKYQQFLNKYFDNNVRRGLLCGLMISTSPVGGLISMGFSYFMIKKSYKIPILLSSILSMVGNLIFVLGIVYSYITLIGIGRLITGFSLNTPVHRNYLLYFIPKRRMSKYLLYFKLTVLIGNSFGPLLSCFCLLIMRDIAKIDNFLNAYTLPGWICFTASIILLILIIIMFSEPLNSKFVIYAEGQAPGDANNRAASFAIDNNLTRYEAEKLNEINQKVSNFNDENQFNDTNLVSLTIKELIELETEPYGTIRKAFWVIMSFVFILSFTKFCYITMAPPYLYTNISESNDPVGLKEQRIISALYFTSFFLIVPTFCINFFYISMRINQILYIKIVSLIFFVLELGTTTIIIQVDGYPYIFYISFLFTILLAYIVEDQLIYFYTHIIPSNFKIGRIEGLTVLHIIKYLGEIFGSASSLFAFILKEKDSEEKNVETFMKIQNIFTLIIQLILIIIFYYYSSIFSDRPIRRIIYNKNKREIKITEF